MRPRTKRRSFTELRAWRRLSCRSVQINVGTIDVNTGLYTNTYKTYALSGYVRGKGESDMALTDLVRKQDEQQL